MITKVNGYVFGDFLTSFFCSLGWYVSAAKSINLGNHIVLEVDEETKQFRRLFVVSGREYRGLNIVGPFFSLTVLA